MKTRSTTACRRICFYVLNAALIATEMVLVHSSRAAIITLNAGDSFGTTSFNAAGNWSNSVAPSPDNDYVVSVEPLRTPADGNSYFFEGNSLTVTATGRLMYKGSGTGSVITINNLTLSGGLIDHRNSFADIFRLAGSLAITAPSVIAPQQGAMVIDSTISGTGDLTVPATDNNNAYTLTLNGINTYAGTILMGGNLVLGVSGSLLFDIGANGINNSIVGTGSSTFDGMFVFDLSGASANLGDSWALVDTATKTFGSTFVVDGFVEADDVWTAGVYQFSEATGLLTVVPEPTAISAILGGASLIVGFRRSRRRASLLS